MVEKEGATVMVSVTENLTIDRRTATITVSSGEISRTVNVTQEAAKQTTVRGVEINGVTWASHNVDAPGKFALTEESPGMFYQWNRKIGWSSSDPMINSDGGTTWDSSTPSGTEWEKANDPCPTDWRVPTSYELSSLVNSGSTWTTQNGVTGRVFGSGRNTVFLPAAGTYDAYGFQLYNVGALGCYWSSTRFGSSYACHLRFYSGGATTYDNGYRSFGYSVRRVAE
jgi:uncharacterized protein (TIGR02145 family)